MLAPFEAIEARSEDQDPEETREWVESVDAVIAADGRERAQFLVERVSERALQQGIELPVINTPYVNTIPVSQEASYPGDPAMEKRIRRIIRWNAMAMVARANKRDPSIGGHLSTYASSASLYEVGFHHFFRGKDAQGGGDHVFFQGHAAPGMYARAFLEGRIDETHLENFRRETSGAGLSSYPHPFSMPSFWEFPTVSMGLGPIAAIYQARFNRYLQNRGIKDTSSNRVWCFVGDGETDEVEATGALGVASRDRLDNLIFVVNCNLQRLDGPVRGNGKIIQELERVFRGHGWHVLKVIWGSEWDALLARDHSGLLQKRLGEVVDGQFQKYSVESGAYIRKHFFGVHPELLALVQDISDEDLKRFRRGGHSMPKVYAAYEHAVRHRGSPVVILAQTVKGWSLGEGYEASNVTHQMKKYGLDHLKRFRNLLQLPIPDDEIEAIPYYHPGKDSPEVRYTLERRQTLGGSLPERRKRRIESVAPADDAFAEFYQGSKAGLEVSTTMAFVRLLRKLLRDKKLGRYVVPIVPDEARTFGMDVLFREVGIYSPVGQKYEPVDAHMLLNYHEATDGQLLEEGITEAGSMASLSAAATAYASHGVPTIPFYIFYSMFGLQRTGDQLWALGDQRGRGFMLGATAGRTTLAGEGLQHDDGQSQLHANVFPHVRAYDPAYAYETAVIVKDGLTRMLEKDEDVIYYITLYNENYAMPPLPEGHDAIEEAIVRGMYLLRPALEAASDTPRVQLFGSGTILRNVLEAQRLLAERFGVAAEVWSVTSYQQLYRDGRACERHNRLHPQEKPALPYVAQALVDHPGPVVAASDWVAELPSLIARFLPAPLWPLGTGGFGRSDVRTALRQHFEIDPASIAVTALYALRQQGTVSAKRVADAIEELQVNPEHLDPMLG